MLKCVWQDDPASSFQREPPAEAPADGTDSPPLFNRTVHGQLLPLFSSLAIDTLNYWPISWFLGVDFQTYYLPETTIYGSAR